VTVVLHHVTKQVKVKKVLPCALRYEGVWGSGCINLGILDLGTSRK
jgi:hypothetical protein